MRRRPPAKAWGANMISGFPDPFDTLFNLQRALEGRLASDWLHDQTASQGPFPPINVCLFQTPGDSMIPGCRRRPSATLRSPGRRPSPIRKAPAFIGENVHSVNSIARCRSPSSSIPIVSKQNIGTASSPCTYRGRSATSREQSRPQESEQDDKWSFCLTAGTLCPANQERQ